MTVPTLDSCLARLILKHAQAPYTRRPVPGTLQLAMASKHPSRQRANSTTHPWIGSKEACDQSPWGTRSASGILVREYAGQINGRDQAVSFA
jgi:hypothetical protein